MDKHTFIVTSSLVCVNISFSSSLTPTSIDRTEDTFIPSSQYFDRESLSPVVQSFPLTLSDGWSMATLNLELWKYANILI